MAPIQRLELIRPILLGEKTAREVHAETKVPLRTLYRYVKRFREGDEQLCSLVDNSRAPHTHPHWFTSTEKEQVIAYFDLHPSKSARQVAKEMTEAKILSISYHSVALIIKQHAPSDPPFYPRGHSSPI